MFCFQRDQREAGKGFLFFISTNSFNFFGWSPLSTVLHNICTNGNFNILVMQHVDRLYRDIEMGLVQPNKLQVNPALSLYPFLPTFHTLIWFILFSRGMESAHMQSPTMPITSHNQKNGALFFRKHKTLRKVNLDAGKLKTNIRKSKRRTVFPIYMYLNFQSLSVSSFVIWSP